MEAWARECGLDFNRILERSPPLTFHLQSSKIVWVIGIGSDKTGRHVGDGKSAASL